MSLIERTLKLAKEIENFPLGHCSPSDDPDKQTVYLYSFKEIVKRFISSAKRFDDNQLLKMLNVIDSNPEFISTAYDLKAEIQSIIDYINDTKNKPNLLKEKTEITAKAARQLSILIKECLISESANNLPMICSGYGLLDGTIQEAFKSKKNYVHSRLTHLEPNRILEIGTKMKGKYSSTKLDELLLEIYNCEEIGLISEFDNIQKTICDEIKKARFTIWIAVAWFTNKEIANQLYLKQKEGLEIQIILNDDIINTKLKNKLNEIFNVYWIPKKNAFDKLMHNKFCVIDIKTVIHGSYNWTEKANYNDETISVIYDKYSGESFAEQFKKLKTNLINPILA